MITNNKQKSSKLIISTFAFVFSFISLFSVSYAEAGFVYLKNSSGLLVGKITYEKNFINEYVKINSFCFYKSITEGITCEYLNDDNPAAKDPNSSVRLVTSAPGTASLWSAIGSVSNRLDGFIKTVTGRKPDPIVPAENINNLNTFNNTQTNIPTPIVTAPVPLVTSPVPTTPSTPTTNNESTSQPQIVYQVIERAVPGPQGPAGPAGKDGASYSAPTVSYPSNWGSAQFNGFTTTDNLTTSLSGYVKSNTDASLTSLTSASGTFTNLNIGTFSITNLTSGNATFTSATITNLFAGNLSLAASNVNNGTTANSTSTNLFSTNASVTNLTTLNSTSANSTSTNFYATNSSTTNQTSVNTVTNNLFAANATLTNASTTNLFATLLNSVLATITTLWGTTSNFQTTNASTTNASTSNFVTTNTTNLVGVNATISNSSSTNLFSTNASITNATATSIFTNLLNSVLATITTVWGTTSNFQTTNASTTNASTSNFVTTNTTNLLGTNATTINSTSTNLYSQNASVSSLRSNSLFTNLLTALTASFTSLFATTGNFTTLNASTTNSTTSNAATGNIGTLNTANGNFTNITATGTTQLTNVYSSTTNASTSNFATTNTTNLVGVNATVTNATVTNLYVSGNINAPGISSGQLSVTNGTVTNASSTNLYTVNASATNLSSISATITNASTTNFFAENSSTTNQTSVNTNTNNLTSINATLTNASTTNLFATLFDAVMARFTTMFASTGYFTNLNASTTYASTSFANSITSNFMNANSIMGENAYVKNVYATGTINSPFLYASITNASTGAFTTILVDSMTASYTFATTSRILYGQTDNLYSINATLTNATMTKIHAVTASVSDIRSTNIVTSFISALSSSFTSLFATLGNFTTLNASTTNASTSNIANLIADNATLSNATITNLSLNTLSLTAAPNGWLYTNSAGAINASSSPTVSYITATTSTSTFKDIVVYGNIEPAADAVYDLGSPTKRFKSLYVSSTTIYIDNVGLSNIGGQLFWNGSAFSASSTFSTTSIATYFTANNATITSLRTGLTAGYVFRGGADNYSEATSTLFIANDGKIGVGTVSPTGSLSISQNGNVSGLTLVGTWNNAGTTYKGIDVDITNTSSNSNSSLLNLAVGGVSLFKVKPDGAVTLSGSLGITGTTTVSSGGIDMNSNKIVNVPLPVNNTDAVNKAYVDSAFASGVLWQSPVKSVATSSAPGSPTSGDRYILLAGNSGFGACVTNNIAEWNGAAWVCTTASTGTTVFVDSWINEPYNFNGSSWNSISEQVNHNNLVSLQGGQTGEYYHLKASDYNALTGINSQLLQLQTTGTATQFVNLTLTGSLNMTGASGQATITNATFTKVFATTASSTNLFANIANIAVATFQQLFSPLAYFTSVYATTTYATTSNAVTFNGTTGNIITVNSSTTNSDTGNVAVLNTTTGNINTVNTGTVNATGTSQFATILASTTNASTSNITSLTAVNSTFSSATTTNLYATNASVNTLTVANLISPALDNINGTITNATTTKLYSQTASISAATTTNMFSAVLDALLARFTTMFAATGYFTNIYASTTNATTTNTANLIATNSTLTNATATNLSVSNLRATLSNGSVFRGDPTNQSEATSTLFIANNGNVGVRNTSPNAPLSVARNDGSANTAEFTNTSGNAMLSVTDSSAQNIEFGNTGGSAVIQTGSVGRLYVAPSGNVGIASSTPGSLLSIGTVNGINFSTATSTFSSTGGINIINGCFAVNGACVTGFTNGFASIANITDLYASTTYASTSNALNLVANYATLTNATATTINTNTLVASILQATSAALTNLFAQVANITTLNASTTNASTSNIATGNITNLISTSATFTDSTTTNIYAVNASLTTLNTNSLFAASMQSLLATFTTLWATTGNFATLNASTTNASTTNTTNLVATNATLTNATATNLSVTNLSANLTNGYIWRGSAAGKNEATSTIYVADNGGIGFGTTTNQYGGTLTRGLTINDAIVIASSTGISTTSLALYNNNGVLYWNGSALSTGGGFNGYYNTAYFTNIYATNTAASTTSWGSAVGTNATITNATVTSLGFTNYTAGDVLYINATGTVVRLGIGSTGQVLKVSGGLPTWGADATGGGGSGAFATTSDNLAIYPTDTSDVLIVGASATTTTGNIMEVVGNALFSALVKATSMFATAGWFTNLYATTTNATTTNANFANLGTANVGTGNFTNINATGTTQLTNLLASTTNASTSNADVANIISLRASTSYATTTIADNAILTNATLTSATITNLSITNLKSGLTNGFVYRGSTTGLSEATSTLFIANSGNVGIGTTTPTSTLSVTGTTMLDGGVSVMTGNSISLFDSANSAASTIASAGANIMAFSTAAVERLRIDSTGNIGIGTTTPSRKLSVTHTDANPQMMLAYDGSRYASMQVDTAGDLLIAASGNNTRVNDGNIFICTGGSCPSGSPAGNGNLIVENKIGVGSSTPWAAVSVSGGAIVSAESALTDGATINVSFNSGNQQRVVLGGNRAINFTNYIPGQLLRLVLCQDGTGSRTVTWDASLMWSGGTAPTLTTTANKCDVVSIFSTSATGTAKLFGSSVLSF